MPTNPFTQYVIELEHAHNLGNDTEHTHRPALKTLLEALVPGITATNEPKRIKVGAPDYIITKPTGYGPLTLGHIEAKDLGYRLEDIEKDSHKAEPSTREGGQLKRYRAYLPNLILTNYLDYRWYVDGNLRATSSLGSISADRTIKSDAAGQEAISRLLLDFLHHQPERISRPQDLALRMARLTHAIRDMIVEVFKQDQASNLLKGWRTAFAQVLLTGLDQPERTGEFADMFAQTLAYGLFSARVMDTTPDSFTRQEAQRLIPRTNPFLREFFEAISGNRLNDEPYVGYVDDLTSLLANTDMNAVLAEFGKRTRQEDPVVHFYETFLAAYDPKLRETRGVYYTPEPVVSYIVRSVDYLLKTRFGCRDGLADTSTVTVPTIEPAPKVKGKQQSRKTSKVHKVLVLDPATGTGTFLYSIVDHIRSQFMQRNDAGMWSDYVKQHLLPRLFGFELLMAPYAVAHFKLGLQLAGRDLPEEQRKDWAYDFSSDERLGVYLTNTLEDAHEYANLPLLTWFLADETNAASLVKRELPIMVVLGNPPYSGHSANSGEWINGLLRGVDTQTGEPTANYFQVDGQPLGERNPKWLNDDYVKFIRFAQWRIERSGAGILAFISNNGYIDNPTFKGMRQSLMQTFSNIYILNLHGSTKKKERSPDGSADENVFDIQQGVCIGLFVKETNKESLAKVHHADLWGVRQGKVGTDGKYRWLGTHNVANTEWRELTPKSPQYLFIPQESSTLTEYEKGWKITSIFDKSSEGFKTHRDAFAVAFTQAEARERLDDLLSPVESDEVVAQRYGLTDTGTWRITQARKSLREGDKASGIARSCLYRPFDQRVSLLHPAIMDRPRLQTQEQLIKGNVGLATTRAVEIQRGFEHVICTSLPMDHHAVSLKESNYLFLLYIYPEPKRPTLFDMGVSTSTHGGRRPNLNPEFVQYVSGRVHMTFVPDGKGNMNTSFGPDDIFSYIYAVLHSPSYRHRYAEFLKADFPRIPISNDANLFRELCKLGGKLVELHIMEQPAPSITSYPVKGDSQVETVRYTLPSNNGAPGRVWINKTQYFEGVTPEVWEFHIGGYQVAEKWLKDRKGRQLTYDDLSHYRNIIGILGETMRLMVEIDKAIPDFPIE